MQISEPQFAAWPPRTTPARSLPSQRGGSGEGGLPQAVVLLECRSGMKPGDVFARGKQRMRAQHGYAAIQGGIGSRISQVTIGAQANCSRLLGQFHVRKIRDRGVDEFSGIEIPDLSPSSQPEVCACDATTLLHVCRPPAGSRRHGP